MFAGNSMMRNVACAYAGGAFVTLALSGGAYAQSAEPVRGWLSWRGPQQNGTSTEKGLPTALDPAHPLWAAPSTLAASPIAEGVS